MIAQTRRKDARGSIGRQGGCGPEGRRPMDVPGGPTIAMFADPEGNVIGLLKAGTM